jgi:VRR-NUC domain
LDPLYYLRNFESALAELERRDSDLLEDEERAFLGTFCSLPESSRALLTRLIMRGTELIRRDALRYAEIEDLERAALPLIGLAWVTPGARLNLNQLLALFTKAELCHALKLPRAWLNRPNSLLQSALTEHEPEVLMRAAPLAERVWRLAVKSQCDVIRALYFGNFRQEWQDFVLAELKVRRFQQVAPAGRPFETADQVRAFKALRRCQQLLDEQAAAEQIEPQLPPSVAGCDWLEERRLDYMLAVARRYERQAAQECALRLYALIGRQEARQRERVLQAQGSPRRSRGVSDQPFGSIPIFEKALDCAIRGRGIEHEVRRHLLAEAPSSAVFYVENSLLCSLFGLLCWRAIFAPVCGAFFHGFHSAPADLASRSFHLRRRALFDECLAELGSLKYRDTIRENFSRKRGIACALVSWGSLRHALLERALESIPPTHLGLCFTYLLQDLRENRAGFPDLIQFFPDRSYRLIEVKGPKDRLQANQRRCLEYLHANGLPVFICRPRASAEVTVTPSPGGQPARPARARPVARYRPELQMSLPFA